jgi:hypothetical protein
MDARKSHFMGLIWASIVIVFFTVAATVIIVTWSPILPEAIAVDMQGENIKSMDKAAQDFLPYIALHQTESWRYSAALQDPLMIAACPR